MSKITTIKQAKEASLEKWKFILTRIEKLGHDSSYPCGFCYYTEYIKNIDRDDCYIPIIEDKCSELVDIGTSEAFSNLVCKINKVISFIENCKEDG